MPIDQNTTVKLLDAKIAVILDLLRVHPLDEAMSILENVKILLEHPEGLQLERAGAAQGVATLDAGTGADAEATTPA